MQTTWFRLPGNGKAHILIEGDPKYFPIGRALCAPIDRRATDTLHETNEIKPADFCRFCVVANSSKGK